jgi:hypothetical protein
MYTSVKMIVAHPAFILPETTYEGLQQNWKSLSNLFATVQVCDATMPRRRSRCRATKKYSSLKTFAATKPVWSCFLCNVFR